MAAFDTTRTTYGVASFANRTVAFVAEMARTVRAWNDARITRNSLSKLSARELDDIGLSYGDIEDIATRTR